MEPRRRAHLAFAHERVRFALEQRGFRSKSSRGATRGGGDVSPLRARRVAEALQGMRASEDFQALAVLFKRVKNIAATSSGPAARRSIASSARRASRARAARPSSTPGVPASQAAAARSDYRTAFIDIAGLRAAVDRFFTEVFVMADDARLRTARLTLMADLRDLILHLADISEIVPQTE